MKTEFNPEILEGELTLKVAIEESIKLWTFLAEDGDRTKENYYDVNYIEEINSIINSGCFLCEYVKRLKPVKNYMSESCKKYNCPLEPKHLCHFAERDSAFSRWYDSSNKGEREQAAGEILEALKKALGELDERDTGSTDNRE